MAACGQSAGRTSLCGCVIKQYASTRASSAVCCRAVH